MAPVARRVIARRRAAGHARPTLILSANSTWFITNFCANLIIALQQAGYETVVVAPNDLTVVALIRELGVEHIHVRLDRSGINPFADMALLMTYRRLLKRVRPVAYLGYTIKPNIYGSMAAASLGIPAIPNVSGLGTAFIRPGVLQWAATMLYRIAFRRVPTAYFQNPDDRQLFVARRMIDAERAQVIAGVGIDLGYFKPAPVPNGPPIFLLVARLLCDKGITEYVDASRSLRDQIPHARFQLLGPIDEGNRTAISKSTLEGWVTQGLIEYLGTTGDVRPFIAAASAVVLPSYREGLPRSLVEAAAMGRPLIATDVPGCREVVENQVNGFLCRPGNTESLARAMKEFAELPQKSRNAMGEASRRKARAYFSDQIVVPIYLKALERLLGTHRKEAVES